MRHSFTAKRGSALLASLALASLLHAAPCVVADFSFPDFSDISSLQLNGDAVPFFDGAQDVSRLTDNLWQFEEGSAFTKAPVSLGAGGSFSTSFSFRLSDPQSGGADGLVFVVQNNASTALGSTGGFLGYEGIGNSLGVEFDTFDNGELNGNHVGVDFNGQVIPGGPSASLDDLGQLEEGAVWHSWVDYDGATDLLEVRVSLAPTRPVNARLSVPVDLPTLLGGSSKAFVGFTAATGGAVNNHDVLSWAFSTPSSVIPEASPYGAGLLLSGMVGLAAWRRQRKSPRSAC